MGTDSPSCGYHPHLAPVLNDEYSFACTPLRTFMASSGTNFSLTVTLQLIKSLLLQLIKSLLPQLIKSLLPHLIKSPLPHLIKSLLPPLN